MKNLMNVLLVSALGLTSLHSQAEEALDVFTEVEQIMIVWSPSGNTLGRIHTRICATCEVNILAFDQNTQLTIKGKARPIEDLKLIVDGSGVISTNTASPDRALALKLY